MGFLNLITKATVDKRFYTDDLKYFLKKYI